MVCYGVLQCVTVCYGVLACDLMSYGLLQCIREEQDLLEILDLELFRVIILVSIMIDKFSNHVLA
jgi:hypothetical protein